MIQYRLDNIELREGLGPRIVLEIVQWSDSRCWTIAYWNKKEEGFEMNFVGMRPFVNGIDWHDFGELARTGQIYLSNLNHE